MTVWQLLLSGLHRNPLDHMPWLQELGRRQAQVKRETQERKRAVEELEQQPDRWSSRYQSAWHPEHDP